MASHETITVHNTNASGTTVVKGHIGAMFAPGAVAANQRIYLVNDSASEVDSQADQISSYPDGSIRYAVLSFLDTTTIASSGSREYTVTTATGTKTDSTVVIGDITTDITMEITNISGAGTDTDLSASWTTDSAVGDNVTQLYTGPACVGFKVWAKCDGHEFLKILWYVTRWDDGSTECAPVLSLDYWNHTGVENMNYLAELKVGATSIQSYDDTESSPGDINHEHHSQWAALRTADDDQHCMPHFVTGDIATIWIERDKAYLATTGLVPPYGTDSEEQTWTYSDEYIPIAPQDHRGFIAQTGTFNGTGIFSRCDAMFLMDPTASRNRQALVQSMAGLSINRHFTMCESDGTQTNHPLVLELATFDHSYATTEWNSDGLPTAQQCYRDLGAPWGKTLHRNGYGSWTDSDTWIQTDDRSHTVSYSFFMALLTGLPYLWEAAWDNCLNPTANGHSNAFVSSPFNWWTNVDEGNLACIRTSQTRSRGWTNRDYAALPFTPDDDYRFNYHTALVANNRRYLLRCVTGAPSDGAKILSVGARDGAHWDSPWMLLFNMVGTMYLSNVTQDSDWQTILDPLVKYITEIAAKPSYSPYYRSIIVHDTIYLEAPASGFNNASYVASTNEITVDGRAGLPALQAGDLFYMNSATAITGLDFDLEYQVINPSAVDGDTDKFQLTLNGSDVETFTTTASVTGDGTCGFRTAGQDGGTPATWSDYSIQWGTDGGVGFAGGGGYSHYFQCAVEYANFNGEAMATNAIVEGMRDFLVGAEARGAYLEPTWNMTAGVLVADVTPGDFGNTSAAAAMMMV